MIIDIFYLIFSITSEILVVNIGLEFAIRVKVRLSMIKDFIKENGSTDHEVEQFV